MSRRSRTVSITPPNGRIRAQPGRLAQLGPWNLEAVLFVPGPDQLVGGNRSGCHYANTWRRGHHTIANTRLPSAGRSQRRPTCSRWPPTRRRRNQTQGPFELAWESRPSSVVGGVLSTYSPTIAAQGPRASSPAKSPARPKLMRVRKTMPSGTLQCWLMRPPEAAGLRVAAHHLGGQLGRERHFVARGWAPSTSACARTAARS